MPPVGIFSQPLIFTLVALAFFIFSPPLAVLFFISSSYPVIHVNVDIKISMISMILINNKLIFS